MLWRLQTNTRYGQIIANQEDAMNKSIYLRQGIRILLGILKVIGIYLLCFILILFSMAAYYDLRYHEHLEGWAPGFLAMILAILPIILITLVYKIAMNIRNVKVVNKNKTELSRNKAVKPFISGTHSDKLNGLGGTGSQPDGINEYQIR
jgi:hypothetical protein